MSRGRSGRIVVEIDPDIKDQLYTALVKNKLTLKDWFLIQCGAYLSETYQLNLFSDSIAPNKLAGSPHE